MNFNFLSLIKKEVDLQVAEKGKIEGTVIRVFDDYLVIQDTENNKLLINKNSIICVINLCGAKQENEATHN